MPQFYGRRSAIKVIGHAAAECRLCGARCRVKARPFLQFRFAREYVCHHVRSLRVFNHVSQLKDPTTPLRIGLIDFKSRQFR